MRHRRCRARRLQLLPEWQHHHQQQPSRPSSAGKVQRGGPEGALLRSRLPGCHLLHVYVPSPPVLLSTCPRVAVTASGSFPLTSNTQKISATGCTDFSGLLLVFFFKVRLLHQLEVGCSCWSDSPHVAYLSTVDARASVVPWRRFQ